VEDDDSIGRLVKQYLEQQDGWRVVWLRSGEDAVIELRQHPVRLVVLDIGLPGIDGFEVCRRIRAGSKVPIIMLTARDEEPDRVAGLELGADDYVAKPFSPRELAARLKAILRRVEQRGEDAMLTSRDIVLRRDSRDVTVAGAEIEPGDAVGLLVARRQHHDRHLRLRAKLPAHLEAVDARQADVEDDEAHGVAAQLGDRLLAGAQPHDAPAVLLLEVRLDEAPDRVVVLDQQKDAPGRLGVHAPKF
jgi:DNA-binding response OmpR family regulator